jgi:hypothetical protein
MAVGSSSSSARYRADLPGLLREGDDVSTFTFILAEEASFPVTVLCAVLAVVLQAERARAANATW